VVRVLYAGITTLQPAACLQNDSVHSMTAVQTVALMQVGFENHFVEKYLCCIIKTVQFQKFFQLILQAVISSFVAGGEGVGFISMWRHFERGFQNLWRNVTEGKGSQLCSTIVWCHLWMTPLHKSDKITHSIKVHLLSTCSWTITCILLATSTIIILRKRQQNVTAENSQVKNDIHHHLFHSNI